MATKSNGTLFISYSRQHVQPRGADDSMAICLLSVPAPVPEVPTWPVDATVSTVCSCFRFDVNRFLQNTSLWWLFSLFSLFYLFLDQFFSNMGMWKNVNFRRNLRKEFLHWSRVTWICVNVSGVSFPQLFLNSLEANQYPHADNHNSESLTLWSCY